MVKATTNFHMETFPPQFYSDIPEGKMFTRQEFMPNPTSVWLKSRSGYVLILHENRQLVGMSFNSDVIVGSKVFVVLPDGYSITLTQ